MVTLVKQSPGSDGPQAAMALVQESVALSTGAIEESWTLPPQAYTSQTFFDLEVEKILKPSWNCVGHVAQIPNIGDYFTVDLLGEPMVIVRGPDRVRALSTVCLHRWAPVVKGEGNAKLFSCPFHKWGYGLDGRLLGAPFMDRARDFAPENCRLPEFRLEILDPLGLIFVTFSQEAPPVAKALATLAERAVTEDWGFADRLITDVMDQDNVYNWKIQIETYMECYHHIGAHKDTAEPESPGGRSWCEADNGVYTVCHGGKPADATPEELAERPPLRFFLVYPMLMIHKDGKNTGFRILFPVSPGRTRSRVFTLRTAEDVARPDYAERMEKRRQLIDRINEEDNAVNDMQQIGAMSAVARVGRFSHLEACSWHLAQYIRDKLGDLASPGGTPQLMEGN